MYGGRVERFIQLQPARSRSWIYLIRAGDLEILKRGRRRAVLEIESLLHF